MPRERMTANDRAIVAYLRKRYSSSTIAREAERLPRGRLAKRGRPADGIDGLIRATRIFEAVELKRNLRPRYLNQACKRVAAEAQGLGEKLSWETVRKIHREMVARFAEDSISTLEEFVTGLRKRRGGNTSYRGYKEPKLPPPDFRLPPPVPKPK
jgi:hypothetical protein